MPVETLHPVRQPARAAAAVTPSRLRPKAPPGPPGPPGPDPCRRSPTVEGRPRQSAVERLEADKAKYVKSQVALSKQQPVRPDAWKWPLSPGNALPTRRTPTQTKAKQDGVPLDLEHLTSLISGVNDGPQSRTAAGSEDRGAPGGGWSSPAKVRLRACRPPDSAGPPAGTVRRVDVIPQAGPGGTPGGTPVRPPQLRALRPAQLPLRSAVSQLRLFQPRTAVAPGPLKPVAPPTAGGSPPPPPGPSPGFPPASPAVTRLSSSSSRKRPSLTRSKSDLSDRFSRAGTELERFFNLCGLDAADLQDLTGSSSDIVSLARFHSVSAPGSECAGSRAEDRDDGEPEAGTGAERVPYGVSVIERNARVIKWLYGLRQAKDSSTNL